MTKDQIEKLSARKNLPAVNLAWAVTVDGWASCITFAPTAPKAKWIAVNSYREAGYGTKGSWPSIGIKREPRFDKSTLAQSRGCYMRDYVEYTI